MKHENIAPFAASKSGGGEEKRNRKTQILSALLQASALGVFLEGCGGDPAGAGGGGGGGGATPTPPALGSERNPRLATAGADSFTGTPGADWVSYAGSDAGVEITLAGEGIEVKVTHGDTEDTLTNINNLIGSDHADTLSGNALANSFLGGEGGDTIDGGGGEDTASYEFAKEGVRVTFALTTEQRDFNGTFGFEENNNEAVDDILTDIENIKGSNFNDWLTGDALKNILRGLDGNDRLEGVGDNDELYGGAGDDTLVGDAGDDFLDGGAGTDTAEYQYVGGGIRVNLARAEAQIDFDGTHGFTANDNDAVGDTLANIENIRGSSFADWLTGDANDNEIRGGNGNDRLEGGAGADTYVFGIDDGTDTIADDGGTIVFDQGTGNAYAGATYNFVRGQGDAVTLTVRDSSSNTLNVLKFASDPSSIFTFYTRSVGSPDAAIDPALLVVPPKLFEGSEENPFVATDDPDTFAGSEGADWVNYAGSEDGITIYLSDDPIYTSDGWADGDELSGINNLIGSNEADDLSGNSAANIIRGGGGDDTITGEEGEDTLQGGYGNDMLQGNEGADTIDGGAGTEDIALYGNSSGKGVRVSLLLQGQGQKQIDFDGTHGFTANDNEAVGDTLTNIENLQGSIYDDWLTGDDNDNEIQGGNGNDRLEGNAGDDALYGGFNDDALYGGEGDDFLEGGLGADILDGGDGEDTAYYDSYPPPTFRRGVRVDLSNTGAQQDFETNSFGFTANDNEAVGDVLTNIENLDGSSLNDWLTGNSKNNILRGLAGNDRLEGGADADTLEGGLGADTLVGGADADTYLFNAGDGTDTITDDGGAIVFNQGTNGDYTGATYTFVRGQGDAVTLTVMDSSSNTLNVLKFASDPSSSYTFYTRVQAADGSYTDTAITLPAVPARLGSEENPFVATDDPDTFAGSEGADWVNYAGSDAGIKIYLSDDPIYADGGWADGDELSGINNLIGSNEADLLVGNGADNILRGGEGNDTFDGGDGADTLDGGEGRNVVFYQSAGNGVRVDLTLAGAQQDFEEENGFTANDNEAVGDILINIDNIVGSDYNDWLTGNDNDNGFIGGTGDDRIDSGGGDDIILGDLGADTIDGGAGEDTASYSDSGKGVRVNLLLQGQAQQDFETNNFGFTANDNEAVDDILTNIENLFGSKRDDWLTGDGDNNDLFGYTGNDRLEGGAGDDTYAFNVGDGTDTIIDDGGAIVFDQGTNGDYTGATYTYTRADGGRGEAVTLTVRNSSNTTINVLKFAGDPSSSYTFYTRVQAEYGSYTDTAITLPAVPARLGSEENPFVATDAADTFVALAGADWASYAGSTAGVTIELDTDPATVSDGFAAGDTLTGINNLIGSGHADTLSGNGADNILRGGLGDDTLEGGTGADTLDGGEGLNFALYQSAGNGVRVDLTLAGAQQDFEEENGFTANDNEAVGDILINIGNIIGSDHNDWLTGNDNDNIIVGEAGNDRIDGGGGDDGFLGGLGADTIDGGAGEDTVSYDSSGKGVRVDLSNTGAQQDFEANSFGFTANDNEAVGDILTNIENIRGSRRDDWLTGDGDNNELFGYADNDRLEGGAGDDTYLFNAGDGTDTIIDDGGNIVFDQGINGDYTGATYTYTRADGGRGEAVTLTVRNSSNTTINVLKFAGDPSSSYTFYTRVQAADGSYTDTAITLPGVPARLGSEENPFLATDAADTFVALAGADWASYAGSNAGVSIELDDNNPATLSGGWAAGDTLTNINNLIGSDHADTLRGNGADNILRGGLGADTLEGGAGADTLDGGADADEVSYSNSSNGVRVDLSNTGAQADFDGADANDNEAVDDVLTDIENITGSDQNDWLTGNDDANRLVGGAGDDRLEGGADADTLEGGLGADTLEGGADADTLEGGLGADTLEGGEDADTYLFNAGDGTDTIIDDGGAIVFNQGTNGDYTGATYTYTRADGGRGEAVILTVTKGGGDPLNVLEFAGDPSSSYTFYRRSSDGTDTAITLPAVPARLGSEGNPFVATADPDTFVALAGADWASYAGSTAGVSIELDDNNPATLSGGWAAGDTLTAIHNLIGSDHADTLRGNSADNTLRGGLGADILEGGLGADTLEGGEGEDIAYYGNSGKGVRVDLSNTGAQQDFEEENGFTANDNEAVDDVLTDIENIRGSDHNDWLTGDNNANTLVGGAGDDRLEGGADDDTLDGGAGVDILDGGAGEDTASYSNSALGVRVDLTNEAQADFEGADANDNEAVGDRLTNIENITGSDYNDWLTGNGVANKLVGGTGNDRLEGGADADTLEGGLGADTLEGGADADTYAFNAGDGTDTIIDDGGTIVFLQGTNGDYAGATYTLVRADGGRGEAVTLTVRNSSSNTLNILKFAGDPSSIFTFYTRSVGSPDAAITLPAVPARLGSEGNPFVATDAADTFVALAGADWASYAGSTAGVSIELDDNNPATLSGGWAAGDTLTAIHNLIGSDHADTLRGNGADNTLRGGLGADMLEGGAGADTLEGGGGTDEVSYSNSLLGVRVDLAIAGAQADFEEENGFTANDNEAVGDILTNIENILGSSHNDWLTGDGNANTLVGGAGDDRLEGGGGNDTLEGGTGADTIDGGGGTDTASYSSSSKGVRVDLTLTLAQQDFETNNFGFSANDNEAEDDILLNIEHITGSDHNDWLTGNGVANRLVGGTGNDRLEGGAGADTYMFNAGDGTDTIIDSGAGNNIVFDQGVNGDAYTGATYTYTRADGGRGEAVILTVRDSSSNTLNVLEFASDPSSSYTFYTRSSDGTDTEITLPAVLARLGSEENPFVATDAADTFVALAGAAWASYVGSTAGVSIELDDNNPATLSGGWAAGDTLTAIHNLIGSDHADTLRGNGADNTLRGGLGADTLEGGLGADTLDGGGGTDAASYSSSSNGVRVDLTLTGAQADFDGADANDNEAVDDVLTDIENITGSDHNDWLTGNGDANTLVGGAGNDTLEGGADADTLEGGVGADTIDGGEGEDIAYYGNSSNGVRVDLSNTGAQQDFETNNFGFTANDNEAEDDILLNIENITGSDYNDWLTGNGVANRLVGGAGDDRLEGGAGADTYMFNAGDGTDTIIDSGAGNNIVFDQGTNGDYTGATYTYTRVDGGRGEAVILTVTKGGGDPLNVLKFAGDPSSIFTFYTRSSDGTDNKITLPAVPARLGSEENPFVATNAADTFVALAGAAWASYAGSTAGVTIELDDNNPATLSGGWAAGDTLTAIHNLIGSAHVDSLRGNGADNILRGGLGADILEGGLGADILEGGVGQDDYIFGVNSGADTIKSDSDGGRLLFRDTESLPAIVLSRDIAGDVTLSLDGKLVTIDDSGSDDAYQQGSYSVHYGAADSFFVNIHIGNNSKDTIRGTSDADFIVGLANNDTLYGYGGNDRLDGGTGNDRLDGGGGADIYRFDAGDGLDIISIAVSDGLGNRLVFRAQLGRTYTDASFKFDRGIANDEAFSVTSRGSDLRVVVAGGGQGGNTVYIEDYFLQQNNDAYTIYRTTFGSQEEGQVVSTMGYDETF